MSCTRLQALTLCNIDSEAFVQSSPWACLGLKRLALTFQKWGAEVFRRQFAPESRAIWQRISRLAELEHLNMFPHDGEHTGFQPMFSQYCGLGLLSPLTRLRQIDIESMQAVLDNAHWMFGAWPRLEVVRCQNMPTDRESSVAALHVFWDKGISVEARGIGSVYEPL